jgi:hypothetical protein
MIAPLSPPTTKMPATKMTAAKRNHGHVRVRSVSMPS